MDDHWAAPLIGKPYVRGARGPATFDCWGLVQFVWRERLGIAVPDVGAAGARMAARIRAFQTCGHGAVSAHEVVRPDEMDAVYMTSRSLPHHVGIWIASPARDGVLHAVDGAGVVFQRTADLAAHDLRIVAFMRLDQMSVDR